MQVHVAILSFHVILIYKSLFYIPKNVGEKTRMAENIKKYHFS